MELVIKLPLFHDIPFFYKVKEPISEMPETQSGVKKPVIKGQQVRSDNQLHGKYIFKI